MPDHDMTPRLSQAEFLERVGVSKSFLTYHNFGSEVSEFLEIGMPYMIMYESLDLKNDRAVMFEFTESTKNYIYSSFSSLAAMGPRPLHSHDFYELTIVLAGEIKLEIENEIVTYRAGECCLCNKNIHHREIFDTDFEIVLFMFKEEYIRSILEKDVLYDENGNVYTNETFFHHLFVQNQQISFYSAKEYIDFRAKDSYEPNQFFELLNTILLEISGKQAGKCYMMQGYFCRFIALIGDEDSYLIRSHQAKLSKEETLLYQVSLLLEQRKGNISRKELEKQLNYNGDYLNRIVKKYTGKTLSEYGKIFLLKEAALLLKNTDMKIGDICEQLGYTNRSFFNRQFIARYGMPPGEYRKRGQTAL